MKKFFLLFITLTIFFSFCCNNKSSLDDYCGTWNLKQADEETDKLLRKGLSVILKINDDKTFQIYSRINGEKKLLNEGEWNFSTKEEFARFSLPDNEYGGNIKGKFVLRERKLLYQTAGINWIFE